MYRVKLEGNLNTRDEHERYTRHETLRCWRCGFEQRVVHFDRRGYWRSFERRLEDERLERIIRRATR